MADANDTAAHERGKKADCFQGQKVEVTAWWPLFSVSSSSR